MKSALANRLTTFVVILCCLFLAVAGYAVYRAATTPLAESIGLQTAVEATAQPLPAAAQAAPARMADTCGMTGSQVILFAGEDTADGVWPKGADSVRIVKVDYANQKIVVVGFPRDLVVRVDGLASHPEAPLGLAYYYQKEATQGSEKHRVAWATSRVGQALLDNFGVQPEFYLTLMLDNVPAAIDKLGGVEIDNPKAFTSDRNVSFPAGKQTLNGRLSGEFNRAYLPGGDQARMRRQNLFMQAFQEKITSAGILPRLPDLLQEIDQLIVTDLSPKQLASLACMAKATPKGNITFHQIEGELVTSGANGQLSPNSDLIKAKLNEWLGE